MIRFSGRIFFMRSGAIFIVLLFLVSSITAVAQEEALSDAEIYDRNCVACHGPDGTGGPGSLLGFKVPLPDFTGCSFASREGDGDWLSVTEKGGPARGFSRMMPAFGQALTRQQMQQAIDHIRTFCDEPQWPRGELNLPRPLVTTKAFPEDELVLEAEVEPQGRDRISTTLLYEQRLGARNQIELVLPLGWSEQESTEDGGTNWTSSVGDIALGFKRVLFDSLESGSIVSLAAEVSFPTGDDEEGFGSDTTVFEPYLLYGQLLPSDFFFHFQGGVALPFDADRQTEEGFWRAAAGRMINAGKYGRRWSPMVELTGSREFASGADTLWDAVPQMQVTLSDRQHVRLAAGARIPLNKTDERDTTYMAYLLWDWFDGGFFDGW